ncbi:toll-like receptor 1 [Physella acuta]|uniref:toll-like receptor 1 n=1 Tax=Physella acuta TaxID=109671 RepID=UPI0027DDEC77|nr:toll-like receptor 1 [Physella acuta]
MSCSCVLFLSVLPAAVVYSLLYVPPRWTRVCQTNESRPADSAGTHLNLTLTCAITPKDFPWKLMDLRVWIMTSRINAMTGANNRTVHYHIQVTCQSGANVSVPWPMKVPGLRELRIYYCVLLDRYANYYDTVDPTLPDELRVLEIHHSRWAISMRNIVLENSMGGINISDEYDCGQARSLEIIINRNVSDFLPDDLLLGVKKNTTAAPKLEKQLSDFFSEPVDEAGNSGTVKPETRLIKDAEKVVSDQVNLNADASKSKQPSPSNQVINETLSRQAKADFLELLKKSVNTKTKCNYTKLRVLEESQASLTPSEFFEFLVQTSDHPVLEVMNYSYIGMTEVPRELSQWRRFFPRLKYLDISHNKISRLDVKNYPSEPNSGVVTFDLHSNNFTTINMDEIKSWANVENFFVDIRNNPIHCDCELASFLPYLQQESTFTGQLAAYEYVKFLQCATPEDLAGRPLHTLTHSSLMCAAYETHDEALIALGVSLGILLILIIVLIRYKIEIRILLYTRLHLRLPCDAEDQRHNKTYDAFVSYSNDDDTWVFENLITFLENRPVVKTQSEDDPSRTNDKQDKKKKPASGSWLGENKQFKLCIHQRDFIPGKTIFDNIVDSIESSRHTIIVLSPSFLKSYWAMEELRQAYRQSLVEKTRHLIVLLLQKVPKEEMDPLIRRCCRTFTYLDVSDALFRDRLVFSLTTKDNSAKRRDRLRAASKKHKTQSPPKSAGESPVYDTVSYSSSRPRPEPMRGLSVTSTSSTRALNSPTGSEPDLYESISSRQLSLPTSQPGAYENSAYYPAEISNRQPAEISNRQPVSNRRSSELSNRLAEEINHSQEPENRMVGFSNRSPEENSRHYEHLNWSSETNVRQLSPPRGNSRELSPPRGNSRELSPPRGNSRELSSPLGHSYTSGSPIDKY